MEPILNFLKENLRHNFTATVFMIVAGAIAAVFIGYLILDSIKNVITNARRKKPIGKRATFSDELD